MFVIFLSSSREALQFYNTANRNCDIWGPRDNKCRVYGLSEYDAVYLRLCYAKDRNLQPSFLNYDSF